jgi:hypothetical protein
MRLCLMFTNPSVKSMARDTKEAVNGSSQGLRDGMHWIRPHTVRSVTSSREQQMTRMGPRRMSRKYISTFLCNGKGPVPISPYPSDLHQVQAVPKSHVSTCWSTVCTQEHEAPPTRKGDDKQIGNIVRVQKYEGAWLTHACGMDRTERSLCPLLGCVAHPWWSPPTQQVKKNASVRCKISDSAESSS